MNKFLPIWQKVTAFIDEDRDPARLFLYLCMGGLILFFVWAAWGTLAVVSTSGGEVVPSSQVKTVQHLEGGIVREINVKAGDNVKAGEPLVVLESTASGADVLELRARITGLRVEMARLAAEAAGAPTLQLDEAVVGADSNLAREAQSLFTSRRNRLKNELASQTAFIEQRQQDIREGTARVRNARSALKLLDEQIKISEQLLREDLTNRYNHLNLLREAATFKGAIEEGEVAIERAKSALTQAEVNLTRIQNNYDEEIQTSIEATRRQLDEFQPRLEKFEDNLQRTTLRAPVSGTVKLVHVATIGGVVGPGDAVVDIVPADDRLVIEAKLPTQDIGFVREGQDVLIKLASADAMRFDGIDGKVVTVSPDTLTTPDGQPFYRVRIETARDHFKSGANQYDLFPGMQVIASIHTGERTVLQYLLDPFLSSADIALTER